jgi:hypothetical protein
MNLRSLLRLQGLAHNERERASHEGSRHAGAHTNGSASVGGRGGGVGG